MSENTSKGPGRRRFIANAGAGLAGAGLLSAKSYGRVLGANDRIQLAIIGSGGRGRSVMGSFAKIPKGMRIYPGLRRLRTEYQRRIKTRARRRKTTMDYREVFGE